MNVRRVRLLALASVLFVLQPAPPPSEAQTGALICDAEMPLPQVPRDLALCAELAPVIRDPSALPLGEYEAKLGDFLRNFCHRDAAAGWVRDKFLRDTGPYVATLDGASWSGQAYGTHAPVVIWYSPEMLDWLRVNRPADAPAPAAPAPVPDGAVMIKEMYPKPAAACASLDPLKLRPTSGAAVMIRDREASQDGWFWGWFGWSGWDPDWPAGPNNRLAYMGFGQYCVNCHGSAEADLTFASLANVEGEPGRPLVFLSQHLPGPAAAATSTTTARSPCPATTRRVWGSRSSRRARPSPGRSPPRACRGAASPTFRRCHRRPTTTCGSPPAR